MFRILITLIILIFPSICFGDYEWKLITAKDNRTNIPPARSPGAQAPAGATDGACLNPQLSDQLDGQCGWNLIEFDPELVCVR